jgi:3-isopropylmalate/(R)-2-methylmalate dehydratase small subunit
MNNMITATAFVCGDAVTAYQIIAQRNWALGLDSEELGKWAMEGVCPEFQGVENGFKNLNHQIVIAGNDFGGGGKSIEHPIIALQGAGVKLILAESFSRYAFRNAINLGLPAMLCPGITNVAKTGDRLSVTLLTGVIKNESTGEKFKASALPELVLKFVEYGGMLAYVKQNRGL